MGTAPLSITVWELVLPGLAAMFAITEAASVATDWFVLLSSSTNRGISRTMSSTQFCFSSSGSRST